MRWAWKIGRLAGIDVHMHATFLLLVGFIFVATRVESHNVARTLFGVLFVLVIFGGIVLHELGSAAGQTHGLYGGHADGCACRAGDRICSRLPRIVFRPLPFSLSRFSCGWGQAARQGWYRCERRSVEFLCSK